jgi:hypothetical protein
MLAERGRFPQSYCAGGRAFAVYEMVTILPHPVIDPGHGTVGRCERTDPSQKKRCATRHGERRSPKALDHAAV